MFESLDSIFNNLIKNKSIANNCEFKKIFNNYQKIKFLYSNDNFKWLIEQVLSNTYTPVFRKSFIYNDNKTCSSINNIIKDLYILDNYHDLDPYRLNNVSKTTFIKKELYKKIKINNTKCILKDNDNVNDPNIIKNIFKNTDSPIINKFNLLYKSNKIHKNQIYIETSKFLKKSDGISPFKIALDSANTSNDSIEIRKNILNNSSIIIDIPNYNNTNINIILTNQNIELHIDNNNKYYEFFMKEINLNSINTVKYKNKYYILINNIQEIFNKLISIFDIYIKDDDVPSSDKNEWFNYVYAGLHIKRLGDYSQVKIFNNTDMKIFQTTDKYCYIYSCLVSKENKINILGDGTFYFKFYYKCKLYSFEYDNIEKSYIDDIKYEINKILTNKVGGSPNNIYIKYLLEMLYNKLNFITLRLSIFILENINDNEYILLFNNKYPIILDLLYFIESYSNFLSIDAEKELINLYNIASKLLQYKKEFNGKVKFLLKIIIFLYNNTNDINYIYNTILNIDDYYNQNFLLNYQSSKLLL